MNLCGLGQELFPAKFRILLLMELFLWRSKRILFTQKIRNSTEKFELKS